jgi:hypothetical protein
MCGASSLFAVPKALVVPAKRSHSRSKNGVASARLWPGPIRRVACRSVGACSLYAVGGYGSLLSQTLKLWRRTISSSSPTSSQPSGLAQAWSARSRFGRPLQGSWREGPHRCQYHPPHPSPGQRQGRSSTSAADADKMRFRMSDFPRLRWSNTRQSTPGGLAPQSRIAVTSARVPRHSGICVQFV